MGFEEEAYQLIGVLLRAIARLPENIQCFPQLRLGRLEEMLEIVLVRIGVEQPLVNRRRPVDGRQGLAPAPKRRPLGTRAAQRNARVDVAQTRRTVRQAVQVVAVIFAELQQPPGTFCVERIFAVRLTCVTVLQNHKIVEDTLRRPT